MPVLRDERLLLLGGRVVLGAWVGISSEEQVLPAGGEARSVCPPGALGEKGASRGLVRAWPNVHILAIVEVVFFYLGVCGAEELQVILLLLGPEIALPEDVLVGAWLHLVCHVFLPEYMFLLLVGVVALGFGGDLLHELLVVVLAAVFVFEDGLLVEDSLHHLHAYGVLLLVVLAGARIVEDLLV